MRNSNDEARFCNYSKGDNYVYFGSYPQTKVTDESLIEELNSTLLNWKSYGYYSGNGRTCNMKMKDEELFSKLNAAFNELFGAYDSEDLSGHNSESPEALESKYCDLPHGADSSDIFDEDDDFDNTIVLNDQNGEEVEFEFLDLIEYESDEYVVLLPKDDDAEEVVILKVDETDSEDEEAYTSVDDEDTLNAVFKIFKDRFKDEFNFID